MKKRNNIYWKDILIARIVTGIIYKILLTLRRTGLVDMSIVAFLFL